MKLLTTAALPTLREHRARHPRLGDHLGRLITPRHFSRLHDTLADDFPLACDNDGYHGVDLPRYFRMIHAIAGPPPMSTRINSAWPGLSTDPLLLAAPPPPVLDERLLWITVPDVVRCACGAPTHCRNRPTRDCAPIGDAHATLEQFALMHVFLAWLPLAFVAQDGSEHGLIPWDAPGLRCLFIGGSDRWRYSPAAADLVAQAKRRGLLVHWGRASTQRQLRYVASLGVDSFDSSRFSRWRELLLQDGLRMASAGQQLRLTA